MQRIFVYAHDAYGLGNTRRMTAVAAQLAREFPGSNVLLASGSPAIHGFRLPDRVDYIKLPSVTRVERDQYATRYLTTEIADTIKLRSAILRTTVADFAPDVVLVDKKPFGIMRELKPALTALRTARPTARTVLVLRDILDEPARTVPALLASGFERDVNRWYDQIAVLGMRDVFDVGAEYQWSPPTIAKVAYCGYLRTAPGRITRSEIREECGAGDDEALVLVSAGGGEDGASLLLQSLHALTLLSTRHAPRIRRIRALVITGPQAPSDAVARMRALARNMDGVTVREFTDDMASYVHAADLVVSMCGYNSACDILSCGRRALVVPRVHPVREQWVRATRMAQRGLFRVLDPDTLSPETLAQAMTAELSHTGPRRPSRRVDLDGLSRLATCVERLAHVPRHRVTMTVPQARTFPSLVERAIR